MLPNNARSYTRHCWKTPRTRLFTLGQQQHTHTHISSLDKGQLTIESTATHLQLLSTVLGKINLASVYTVHRYPAWSDIHRRRMVPRHQHPSPQLLVEELASSDRYIFVVETAHIRVPMVVQARVCTTNCIQSCVCTNH